jgi:hypothetical protein
MTVATVQLSEALEAMIDSRLDTIDRILMGRVPRQERLAIVREVESQIHELLHERGGDELSREDVLAVLARLDPPEAYLPDDTDASPVSVVRALPTRATSPALGRDQRLGRASGILALGAIVVLLIMTPVTFSLAIGLQSDAVLFVLGGGTLLLVFSAALMAFVLGILARKSGNWAITGIVASLLVPVLAFASGALLILLDQ